MVVGRSVVVGCPETVERPVPGRFRAQDELLGFVVEGQNSSKIGRICGWKGENDGGNLDLPATNEIHGSNPTKLHHTNKSQKNGRAIFVGTFEIGAKSTK